MLHKKNQLVKNYRNYGKRYESGDKCLGSLKPKRSYIKDIWCLDTIWVLTARQTFSAI